MDQDMMEPNNYESVSQKESSEMLSIIIPCYNDHQHVTIAVNSALQQNWTPKEIVIVDDGSCNKTKQVLKSFQSRMIKVITQNNQGTSAARNNGIKCSKGKYILALDSDDFFEPNFSRLAIGVINSRAGIKLVTCYGRWFSSEKQYEIHEPAGGTLQNFLYESRAFGSGLFLKKDWESAGGYDESMKLGFEDWEFYLRLLEEGGEAYVIPEVLFHYRKKKISRNSIANSRKHEIWR